MKTKQFRFFSYQYQKQILKGQAQLILSEISPGSCQLTNLDSTRIQPNIESCLYQVGLDGMNKTGLDRTQCVELEPYRARIRKSDMT